MSSSYTSTSFSSFTSSSTSNGQTTGSHHTQQSHTNNDGTTVHTTSQNHGGPRTEQTSHYDAQGRQLVGNGNAANGQARIEDVTDADKLYEERMEDEYAKREGGA